MYLSTHKPDISTYTIRLVIGLIAITLPFLTSLLATEPLTSISAAYCDINSDWPRNIFVGFLIAISALFLAYNGSNSTEFYLSKIGSAASFLIATFPGCGPNESSVHGIASVIMFSVLAVLCYQFYKSSSAKPFPEAQTRSIIYKTCGIVIILSMLIIALKGVVFSNIERLVFYGETAALLAFGIAWFVASHIIPITTNSAEKVNFLPKITKDNPD